MKISAKATSSAPPRISQGDIFKDIDIVESLQITGSEATVRTLHFPFVICLNQECDLEQDFNNQADPPKDISLIHLAFAPAHQFEYFLKGAHWGGIFAPSTPQKISDTKIKLLVDNEIPRYHYLKFPDTLPELVIDFKHFFTISRHQIYQFLPQRLCSLDDLFREKVSQRFAYYISRIGLPDHKG